MGKSDPIAMAEQRVNAFTQSVDWSNSFLLETGEIAPKKKHTLRSCFGLFARCMRRPDIDVGLRSIEKDAQRLHKEGKLALKTAEGLVEKANLLAAHVLAKRGEERDSAYITSKDPLQGLVNELLEKERKEKEEAAKKAAEDAAAKANEGEKKIEQAVQAVEEADKAEKEEAAAAPEASKEKTECWADAINLLPFMTEGDATPTVTTPAPVVKADEPTRVELQIEETTSTTVEAVE